jgi:hypothetical protein
MRHRLQDCFIDFVFLVDLYNDMTVTNLIVSVREDV